MMHANQLWDNINKILSAAIGQLHQQIMSSDLTLSCNTSATDKALDIRKQLTFFYAKIFLSKWRSRAETSDGVSKMSVFFPGYTRITTAIWWERIGSVNTGSNVELSCAANFLEIIFIVSLVFLSVALAFELNIWTVKTEFIWTYFGCTSMTVSLFGVLLVSKMSLEAGKRKSSKISFISFSPENTRDRQED